jgi:cysteine synthase A
MSQKPCPNWVSWAIGRIDPDYTRSADTHLIPVPLPVLSQRLGPAEKRSLTC